MHVAHKKGVVAKGAATLGLLLALTVGGSSVSTAAPVDAAAATGSLAAASPKGSCKGQVLERTSMLGRHVRSGEVRVIGEITLTWNEATGRNCLKLTKVGPVRGVKSRTGVQLWPCRGSIREGLPGCLPPDARRVKIVHGKNFAMDDASYRFYAGPITVPARDTCINYYAYILDPDWVLTDRDDPFNPSGIAAYPVEGERARYCG